MPSSTPLCPSLLTHCGACADLQLTGFGLSSTYHADNEYALLSDLKSGFKVFFHLVAELNGALAA